MTIDKREVNDRERKDKSLMHFMWIVGLVVSILSTMVAGVALSYGQTKEKVVQHGADILHLQKRSVDVTYIQDLIQSNYMLVDILKAAPKSHEMEEALKAWREFQMVTIRRANPTRKGSINTETAK